MLLLLVGYQPQEFQALYQHEKLLNAIEQLVGPDIGANPVWNTRPKVPGVRESYFSWHQGRAVCLTLFAECRLQKSRK